ncbi:MAG: glycosyltransferase [Prevotella sp.]|nr:glycosyltransferase [Prevotella sp.]
MLVQILSYLAAILCSIITANILTRGLLNISRKHRGGSDDGMTARILQTGGVIILPAIAVGVAAAIAVRMIAGTVGEMLYTSSFVIAVGVLLLYALGIIDDLLETKAWQRNVIVAAASAAFPLIDLYINNLHGLFGIHYITWIPGFFITFIFTVLTIKSLEALDDTDGLMAATGLLVAAAYAVAFCLMGSNIYATIAFALAGALMVFLRHNLFGDEKTGDKLRAGHTGRLVVSYCIAYLSVKYAMDNAVIIDAHSDGILLPYSLLALPVFEYVRVFVASSWRGLNDKERQGLFAHHIIIGKGFSQLQTTGIVVLGELVFLLLNLLLYHVLNFNITLIVVINLALYVVALRTADKRIEAPKPRPIPFEENFKDFVGKEGLVSVIMPTYNSSQFVAESIDSIIAQTYKNWELVITDDCSTDNTLEILRTYAKKDPRIVIQTNEHNGGAGITRNKCIAAARGQYISFCDSDDRWLPKKLELQLDFMRAKDVALCFSPYYSCDENNQYLGYISAPEHVSLFDIMCDNKIGFLTCIYDTSALGKHLMPRQRKRQDHAMLLNLLRICHTAYSVPRPLAFYRIHPGNLSRSKISLLKYNAQTYTEVFGWPKPLSYAFLFILFLPTYFAKRLKNIVINAARSA